MKIALIFKSMHPYWKEVEVGAQDAGKKYNCDILFFSSQKEETSYHIETIDNLIREKIQGIGFATSFPELIAPAIRKAITSGIHCIAIDSDAPQTDRYFYLGTNNYLAGKIAGDTMIQLINREGEVIITTGSLSAQNSIDRIMGFKEVVLKYPTVKIVDTLCNNETEAMAISQIVSSLAQHPNISGIFGVFSYDGQASAKAIITTGKVGKIKIVGFDTSSETMNYIKQGIISATIGQRPYMIGYRCIEYLHNIIKFGKDEIMRTVPSSRLVDTGVDIITKDNLEQHRQFLQKIGIPVKF